MTSHTRLPLALLPSLPLLLSACADPAAPVVETYAELAFASYDESWRQALTVQAAIEQLVATPSQTTLEVARQTWLSARDVYGQTEVFRFYGGPIDDPVAGPEAFINAWPLDEAYIDYVEGNPTAGVINQPEEYPTLDTDLVLALNERGGETNISAGWHAIEFLLWGQDLSADGPGDRPWQDYLPDAEGGAPYAERRGQYLLLVTELLVRHLEDVRNAWDPAVADNYRAMFLADDRQSSLQKILVGMGSLSGAELAGERIYVAYESRDQEDEHSCFSDNTTADIVGNMQGIANVWNGSFGSVQGTGLRALIEERDPTVAASLDAAIEASLAAVKAIPAPFDQHLKASDDDPGRQSLLNAVEALEAQTELTVEAATALELTINIGT